MLEFAGISVAVGNAPPEVRAAADLLVASNDADGVAEAIQAVILDGRAERVSNRVGG